MNELLHLLVKIPESAAKLIQNGTTEKISFVFTFLGRRIGAEITLHLAEAQGQKGNQPASPPQPQPANP